MKRLFVGMSALTSVVVVALITIVHAQRSLQPATAVEPAGSVEPERAGAGRRTASQERRSSSTTTRAKKGLSSVTDPFTDRYADQPSDEAQPEPLQEVAGIDDADDERLPGPAGEDDFPSAAEAFGPDYRTEENQSREPRRIARGSDEGRLGPALSARAAAALGSDDPDEGRRDTGVSGPSQKASASGRKPKGKSEATPGASKSVQSTPVADPFIDNVPDAAEVPWPADVSEREAVDRYGRPLGGEPTLAQQAPLELPDEASKEAQDIPSARFGETGPAVSPGDEPQGSGRPGSQQLEGLQTPSLTLEKAAPEEIQVGKPALFELRVRNTGSVAAQTVEVVDEVPHGTQLVATTPQASRGPNGELLWSLGAIEPGQEVAVTMELMPVDEGEIGSVATVHFAGQASARTLCTRPQIALEVTAPREVLIGEQVTLAIRVSNPGTGIATGVVLSENIPDSLEHEAGPELEYEIGDLKPNETRELDLTLKAVQAGPVVNLLTAHGEGQLHVEEQTAFEVVAPALELSMDGPKRRYLERQATYTVMVSNPGTASAHEVELVTHLPRGMQFVEANNAGQYDPQTNSVHWLLEELPPKEVGTVTLTTLPVEPGKLTLRVEGTAERGLAAEKEEEVLIEGVAAILFQLADVSDPIEVGAETTYEIRVVNQGSKAATNIQLSAQLPSELQPLDAEGPTRHEFQGPHVRFAPLERLAPKADTTYRIHVRGLQPGDMRIRVQIMTDEIRTPVTKEESTSVYADE